MTPETKSLLLRAWELFQISEWEQCAETCNRLLDSDVPPKSRQKVLGMLSDCYFELRRFEQALSVLNGLISEDPSDVSYANRGLALIELGRYEDALDSYDQAIIKNPKNLIARKYKAACLLELNRDREALKLLEMSVDEYKADAGFYQIMGKAYGKVNMWDKAHLAFGKAVLLNPRDEYSRMAKRRIENAAGIF